MLSVNNLLRLPYSPDLTEGGIAYALRSLTYSFNRVGSLPYERLRRTVANAAVELAFRRYLSQQDISFEVQTVTPFTDPERFDVVLDGRRCDLKSYLISHREQATKMRRNPEILLKAPALVPSDHHAREGHLRNDLYIFAFLAGFDRRIAGRLEESNCCGPAALPSPCDAGRMAQTVELESAGGVDLEIRFRGGNADRSQRAGFGAGNDAKDVQPPSKNKSQHRRTFLFSHIHSCPPNPGCKIGIRCEMMKEAHVIQPLEWGNIWVYGMDIFFAGYIPYEEFGQFAKPLPINSRTFQYQHTKVKNLALPVSNLKPLQNLFHP